MAPMNAQKKQKTEEHRRSEDVQSGGQGPGYTTGDAAASSAQDDVRFKPGSVKHMKIYHGYLFTNDPVPYPGKVVSKYEPNVSIQSRLMMKRILKEPERKNRVFGWLVAYKKSIDMDIGFTAEVLDAEFASLKLHFHQRIKFKRPKFDHGHGRRWYEGSVMIEEEDFHHSQLKLEDSSKWVPNTLDAMNIVENVLFEKAKQLCKQHVVFDNRLQHANDPTAFSYWLGTQLPFRDECVPFLSCKSNMERFLMCNSYIEKFVNGTLRCRKCGTVLGVYKNRTQICVEGRENDRKKIRSNKFYHWLDGFRMIPFLKIEADVTFDHGPFYYNTNLFVQQQKYVIKNRVYCACCSHSSYQNPIFLGYKYELANPDAVHANGSLL